MSTRVDARQVISRDVLSQIFPNLSGQELDNLLRSIDSDLTAPLRLDASSTPDLVVSVGSGVVSNPESGRQQSISHVSGVIPDFTSGTITFPASSGGTITVSPGNNNTLTVSSNEYVKVLIYLNPNGDLNVIVGLSDPVEATAATPAPPSGTIPIGYVTLFNNAGTVDDIAQNKIFQFALGAGAGSDGGGAPLQPADGFKELIFDEFSVLPDNADSFVDDVLTTATYDTTNNMYRMECDDGLTANTVGTAFTVDSGAPSYTIAAGDAVYDPASEESRRLISFAFPNGVLDEAFTSDLGALSAVFITQVLVTKDLTALGDAAQKKRIIDFYPSPQDIELIHVDYEDSVAVGDFCPDFVDEAAVVVVASNEGLQAAGGFPLSSTFAPPFTRPNAPDQIPDYPLTDNSDKERLFLVFGCNPSNASVLAAGGANIIRYETSLIAEEVLLNGGFIDSAFAMTDSSTTPNNCSNPTVVGGKTRFVLGFDYVPGLNTGKTEGDVEIRVNGQAIPRRVIGSTQGSYWDEVAGSTNLVELWDDLSGQALSFEAIRRQGSIDTSDENALTLAAIFPIVVGNTADVTAGVANYDSIQDAHDASPAGGKIHLLRRTFTENITISKEIYIEGQGHGSVLDGTLDLSAGSDFSTIKQMRITDDITIAVGADGNFIRECWLASGKSLTDSGSGNSTLVIEE